jgi:hypothetical protein
MLWLCGSTSSPAGRTERILDGIGEPFNFRWGLFPGRVLEFGAGGEVMGIRHRDQMKMGMGDLKTHRIDRYLG